MTTAPSARTILLVVVDQLAARWLEAAMGGIVPVPNLTWIRESGVMFRRAFTNNPVCSPARATIATGLNSVNHGVTECGYDLDPAIPTFMQALQRNGWRTGAFGKLHFLEQIENVAPDYKPYGFDVTHITEDSRVGEWLDWVRDAHPEYYQAAQATVWMTMIPGLDTYGEDRVDLRAEILEAKKAYPSTNDEAYELPFPAEVSQTAWITDRARDFILAADRSQDLFAQVSYVQPHNPFTPPSEFVPMVDCDLIPEPAAAEWVTDPIPYYQQEHYGDPSYETADWKRQRQLYFADIAHLDQELGRLRDALDVAGRADNTLIVFTSDHGELLHDHGLLGKWERHYDACIRVPLLVAGPGVTRGDNLDLVDHTDIAPTIYDWAGVAQPSLPRWPESAEPMRMLPGSSLVRPSSPQRDSVYVQSNNNHWDATPRSWARTIRTDRYRYTRHLSGGGEQLFDLIRDPDEQVNLASEPAAKEALGQLRDQLMEMVSREGYPNSPRQLFRIGSW